MKEENKTWQERFDEKFPRCNYPDTFNRDQWNLQELPALKVFIESEILHAVAEREREIKERGR